jgi:hypothetical protein
VFCFKTFNAYHHHHHHVQCVCALAQHTLVCLLVSLLGLECCCAYMVLGKVGCFASIMDHSVAGHGRQGLASALQQWPVLPHDVHALRTHDSCVQPLPQAAFRAHESLAVLAAEQLCGCGSVAPVSECKA